MVSWLTFEIIVHGDQCKWSPLKVKCQLNSIEGYVFDDVLHIMHN